MASFKNRIVVPKNKTAFSAHIDHIKAGSGYQVSHAPCMSHRIIEVLYEHCSSGTCNSEIPNSGIIKAGPSDSEKFEVWLIRLSLSDQIYFDLRLSYLSLGYCDLQSLEYTR